MLVAIESGGLLDVLEHPTANRSPRQGMLVVSSGRYVYGVPFLAEADHFFLKTVIPSRKATRDSSNPGDLDAEV